MKYLVSKSTIFFCLCFTLFNFPNALAQVQLSDLGYRYFQYKDLTIENYGGENCIIWIKTTNKITNFSELSVFNPKGNKINLIQNDSIPKNFGNIGFYQKSDTAFLLMTDYEKFQPVFLIIKSTGEILFKHDFNIQINESNKILGKGDEVYFIISNEIYSYKNKKLEKIILPKSKGISPTIDKNSKLFSLDKTWFIKNENQIITSDSIYQSIPKLSQSTIFQIRNKLYINSPDGFSELKFEKRDLVLKKLSNSDKLSYQGIFENEVYFSDNSFSPKLNLKFSNDTFNPTKDLDNLVRGAFFEDDSIKIVIGFKDGFAEPAWNYYINFIQKKDTIVFDLLSYLSKHTKYSLFENYFTKTNLIGKKNNKSAWQIRSFENTPVRVILTTQNGLNYHPVIFEKIATYDLENWIVKDFKNYFYYFNIKSLELTLISDPYTDRKFLSKPTIVTYIRPNISFSQDSIHLVFQNDNIISLDKSIEKLKKDTVLINNEKPDYMNDLTNENYEVYSKYLTLINYPNQEKKIKFIKRDGNFLHLTYDEKPYFVNIGTKSNTITPSIIDLDEGFIFLHINNKNLLLNLFTGEIIKVPDGDFNQTIIKGRKGLLFNITKWLPNEVSYTVYNWNGSLLEKEFQNDKISIDNGVNLPNDFFLLNLHKETNEIIGLALYNLESKKIINIPSGTQYEYFGNSSAKIIFKNKNEKNDFLIFYLENEKFSPFKIPTNETVDRTWILNNDIYFEYLSKDKSSYILAKYDLNSNKLFAIKNDFKPLSFSNEIFIIEDLNNKRYFIILEDPGNTFSLGNIKNINNDFHIDKSSDKKSVYFFGSNSESSNSNLFRLEESDNKFDGSIWKEIESEELLLSSEKSDNNLIVYPNPSLGKINIISNESPQVIVVSDILGNLILELKNANVSENEIEEKMFLKNAEIQLDEILKKSNNGYYNFIFKFKNGITKTKKIIVKK